VSALIFDWHATPCRGILLLELARNVPGAREGRASSGTQGWSFQLERSVFSSQSLFCTICVLGTASAMPSRGTISGPTRFAPDGQALFAVDYQCAFLPEVMFSLCSYTMSLPQQSRVHRLQAGTQPTAQSGDMLRMELRHSQITVAHFTCAERGFCVTSV